MFSAPTVAGDLVLVGSCNGFLRALEKKTGRERWTYDSRQDGEPVEFHNDPLLIEDLVILGTDRRKPDGVGHLYAFERETGKPRWKHRVVIGVAADVLQIGSNIYAVTLRDELLCLDWKTGELVWKSETASPNEEFLINSSPAKAGDRIFFGSLDGAVYAFDANSGQVLWKRQLKARVSTSVLYADESLFAGTSDGHLYRLDPKTGTVAADFVTEKAPAERLLFADGSLVAFLGEETLVCLDSSLKKLRWSESASGPWSSAKPYAWGRAVLAGNERGELFAFRISDGTRLWSEKFEGVIRGIGSSKDTLYIGTLKGNVYAWRPVP